MQYHFVGVNETDGKTLYYAGGEDWTYDVRRAMAFETDDDAARMAYGLCTPQFKPTAILVYLSWKLTKERNALRRSHE